MQTAEEFIQNKKEKIKKELPITTKDIGRKGKRKYIIEAATFLKSEELDKKVYVLERLKILEPEGEVAYQVIWKEETIPYRLGYYIVGKIGNKKDKWTWGQYCPMITHNDFFKLIKLAKKEGTIIGDMN